MSWTWPFELSQRIVSDVVEVSELVLAEAFLGSTQRRTHGSTLRIRYHKDGA